MNAVKFEQANIMLAESQEEYETLPIWMDIDESKSPVKTMMADDGGNLSMQNRDRMGHAVCCFELNKEEIDEIILTGKVWLTQCTFWNPFQPINMTTQNPFIKEVPNA